MGLRHLLRRRRGYPGRVGLYPRVGPRALEIGYWLAVAHTGRGLATASARILTEAAFATPNIDRVEMHVEAANVASSGVPRRLGYRALAPAPVAPDPALGAPQLITWVLTRDELAGAFNQTIPT
jgi:RimJ/RimL family protein N-acetyltransferase